MFLENYLGFVLRASMNLLSSIIETDRRLEVESRWWRDGNGIYGYSGDHKVSTFDTDVSNGSDRAVLEVWLIVHKEENCTFLGDKSQSFEHYGTNKQPGGQIRSLKTDHDSILMRLHVLFSSP